MRGVRFAEPIAAGGRQRGVAARVDSVFSGNGSRERTVEEVFTQVVALLARNNHPAICTASAGAMCRQSECRTGVVKTPAFRWKTFGR